MGSACKFLLSSFFLLLFLLSPIAIHADWTTDVTAPGNSINVSISGYNYNQYNSYWFQGTNYCGVASPWTPAGSLTTYAANTGTMSITATDTGGSGIRYLDYSILYCSDLACSSSQPGPNNSANRPDYCPTSTNCPTTVTTSPISLPPYYVYSFQGNGAYYSWSSYNNLYPYTTVNVTTTDAAGNVTNGGTYNDTYSGTVSSGSSYSLYYYPTFCGCEPGTNNCSTGSNFYCNVNGSTSAPVNVPTTYYATAYNLGNSADVSSVNLTQQPSGPSYGQGCTGGYCTINHNFTFSSTGQYTLSCSGSSSTGSPTPTNLTVNAINTTVSGHLFVDYNHNGAIDTTPSPSDYYYTSGGVTVTLNGPSGTQTTTIDGTGAYKFQYLPFGDYSLYVNAPPSGYTNSYPGALAGTPQNPYTFSISPGTPEPTHDFSITPYYSIAGNIFVDKDKNELKGGVESNYTDTNYPQRLALINLTDNTTTLLTTTNGTYTFNNIISGPYKVEYRENVADGKLPPGYIMTYIKNGPPPNLSMSVGQQSPYICTPPDSTHDGKCNGSTGNIITLDFGISNSVSWFQSTGSDMRLDYGFTDWVPATTPKSYASMNGNGGTPGSLFSGSFSFDFGAGGTDISSTKKWLVGGTLYPETFSPVNLSSLRTSYDYYTTVANQSGITLTDISTACGGGITSCDLSTGTLSKGIYISNGDLTLMSASGTYTLPTNTNVIILVNGNLTIKEKILVPNGSSLVISVAKDITIDKSVGSAVSTVCTPSTTAGGVSTGCDLEGLYSVDGAFKTGGNNGDCTQPSDSRLNIAGSVVVNANLSAHGTAFSNQRDLCTNDLLYPAVSITERPDFIFSVPDFVKHPNNVWQEVAP